MSTQKLSVVSSQFTIVLHCAGTANMSIPPTSLQHEIYWQSYDSTENILDKKTHRGPHERHGIEATSSHT